MKNNVVVTAAGSIIGEGIIKCLKLANSKNASSISYEIVATDMSAQAAGLYRGDFGKLLPSPREPGYIEDIVRICKARHSRAIFVGSDEELIPLAENRERLEAESGARLITNPLQALLIATDKWKTYQFLKDRGLPNAESALPETKDQLIHSKGYPVVVKPRDGHGSSNIFLANDETEVESAISTIKKNHGEPILQEFLKPADAEFTTGVTISSSGKNVLSSIAMRRILKHGQTYKAFVDDFDSIRKSAEMTALALGCIGPVNVQSRLVDGEPKIFEINPRFSASCPIRAVAGVNEPDIIFRDAVLGEDVSVSGYQKMVALRYWNELYVPFDAYEKVLRNGESESDSSFVMDYF